MHAQRRSYHTSRTVKAIRLEHNPLAECQIIQVTPAGYRAASHNTYAWGVIYTATDTGSVGKQPHDCVYIIGLVYDEATTRGRYIYI